jgi:hypothetical protein
MMRLVAIGAVACTCALALTACGGGQERSAEAYCKAFYTKAAPIRQGYIDASKTANGDPLGALVKVLSAPGDLESIFASMADHAPDEIKSDTEEVRDSLKKLQDTMGKAFSNPLGAFGDSLGNSLSSAGAWQRVNAYLNQHCPVSSPLAQKIIQQSSGAP